MIRILFENDDIVAVDKPEGLATIPGRGVGKDNVLALVQKRYHWKLYVVHRLDKDTSGVVVFAKNAQAHQFLNQQFEKRKVQKTYLALVHGVIEQDEGKIELPLRQFGSGRVGVDQKQGKDSITEFRVLKRFIRHTLIQAHPVTGRRHQLRVHFYIISHPIVGDPLYGNKTIQSKFPRLMLHAEKIRLTLLTGKERTIISELPGTFEVVLATIDKLS